MIFFYGIRGRQNPYTRTSAFVILTLQRYLIILICQLFLHYLVVTFIFISVTC